MADVSTVESEVKALTASLCEIEADILYKSEVLEKKARINPMDNFRDVANWCGSEEFMQARSTAMFGVRLESVEIRNYARILIAQFQTDFVNCADPLGRGDIYLKASNDLNRIGRENAERIYRSPWHEYRKLYVNEACVMSHVKKLCEISKTRLELLNKERALTNTLKRRHLTLYVEYHKELGHYIRFSKYQLIGGHFVPLMQARRDGVQRWKGIKSSWMEHLYNIKAAYEAELTGHRSVD